VSRPRGFGLRFSAAGKGPPAPKGLGRRRALAAAAALLALTPQLSVHAAGPAGETAPACDAGALRGAIRDGDVVCRLGDRLWSQLFMDVSAADKRYSHLGVARVAGGRVTVIHAEGTAAPGKDGDKVKEEALEDFARIAKAVGVYRAKGLDGGLVSAAAAGCIGTPFDWGFDMDDESRLYCTELLHAIFRRLAPERELATVRIGASGKRVIPLEAVSASERFEEICCVAAENK
jgi:hypothetical protein